MVTYKNRIVEVIVLHRFDSLPSIKDLMEVYTKLLDRGKSSSKLYLNIPKVLEPVFRDQLILENKQIEDDPKKIVKIYGNKVQFVGDEICITEEDK
jgi:hypothetical protein